MTQLEPEMSDERPVEDRHGVAAGAQRTGLHGAPPAPGLRRPALPGAGLLADLSHSTSRKARMLRHRMMRPFTPTSLDERDPDELREVLPFLWLAASLYFRAEVRGMGNVPETGPVLLVGNHSGGHLTPDSMVFTLAFATYFGVERRLHLLTRSHVFSFPGFAHLRAAGVITATDGHAHEALSAGGAAFVYPGGSHESHRPSWRSDELDVGTLEHEVELALEHDAPIVPVVSIGGQETALFLSSGERISEVLGLQRLGIDRVPLALALPWGIAIGDLFAHVPLPSKIVTEVLPPVRVRERFGADADPAEVAAHIHERMRETLAELAEERRLPVIG